MNTQNPFGHIMLDLETLGTKMGSVILSFGAVEFNPKTGEVGKSYNPTIDIASSIEAGLTVDADTLRWWAKQGDEARAKAFSYNGEHINAVLTMFQEFVKQCGGRTACLWGNAASFDLGLLRVAYERTKIEAPWSYVNEMCLRTLKNVAPEVQKMGFVGAKHDPIADCIHQIKQCQQAYQILGVK